MATWFPSANRRRAAVWCQRPHRWCFRCGVRLASQDSYCAPCREVFRELLADLAKGPNVPPRRVEKQ